MGIACMTSLLCPNCLIKPMQLMTTSGLVLVMAFAMEFGTFASTPSSKCLAKFGENQDLAFFCRAVPNTLYDGF